MQAQNPPTVNGIATKRVLRTLALDLADPPLDDFDAFCAVVNEIRETTASVVTEVTR